MFKLQHKIINMKHRILPIVTLLAFAASASMAQSNRSFAVTGNVKGSLNWSFIREIDMNSASIMRDIFPAAQQTIYYDALTNLPIANNAISNPTTSFMQGVALDEAVPDLIAAIAYDAAYNRLYYTYMHGTDLRYIDLNTPQPKLYVVRHAQLKQFTSGEGEEDVITRMTFASDGYGYALTNDGKHLIRFSSGEKIILKNLGSLTDGKQNGNNSVHSTCASFGGDMIGDAFSNLYLFTQRGNIYKISTSTLVADYVGAIKDLPYDFTVNGAAVDEQNNVIISCASKGDNYYSVDMNTLKATAMPKKEDLVYNASDLANKNLLYQSQATSKAAPKVKGNSFVTIYPNPVKNRNFAIEFNKVVKGNYSIELLDATGMLILQKEVNIVPGQIEKIRLPANVTSGAYMLRVTNKAAQDKIYTAKVLVGM